MKKTKQKTKKEKNEGTPWLSFLDFTKHLLDLVPAIGFKSLSKTNADRKLSF